MGPQEHLRIINPSYSSSEDALFPVLSALSTELRLRIWQFSLQQNRLLEIEVDCPRPWPPTAAPPYSTTNELDKIISGRNYTVRGCHLLSKLLSVNRESRSVALKFYRVHIPCHFPAYEDGRTTASVLYVNPEYDFVLTRVDEPPEHSFADFLHDITACDPRSIGLINLALDSQSVHALPNSKPITEASAKAALLDSVKQLREIIWVAESYSGRAILGPLDNFPGVGVRFNHSMPVKASTPTFELLKQDPRSIELDLRYVLTGGVDPRHWRLQWRQLLAKWGTQQAQHTRERVLFASKVPSPEMEIRNIRTAGRYLEAEEDRWMKTQQKYHRIVEENAGKVPIESPEELKNAVRPAIGFWLFPAEALGSLEGDPGELSRMKKVFDMTDHSPELALSTLF